MRLAVLASHQGTTLGAVIDACAAGALEAEVALVISNNSASGAIERAQASGIAHVHLSDRTHEDPDQAILETLNQHRVDYVLLLGYMKKLGTKTIAAYAGRILNTHPALLPKFGGRGYYGRKVHEAVLAAGETVTGATVHLVDAEYDRGAKLSQVRVPVKPGDDIETLEERVKRAEKKLLIETLRELGQTARAAGY